MGTLWDGYGLELPKAEEHRHQPAAKGVAKSSDHGFAPRDVSPRCEGDWTWGKVSKRDAAARQIKLLSLFMVSHDRMEPCGSI